MCAVLGIRKGHVGAMQGWNSFPLFHLTHSNKHIYSQLIANKCVIQFLLWIYARVPGVIYMPKTQILFSRNECEILWIFNWKSPHTHIFRFRNFMQIKWMRCIFHGFWYLFVCTGQIRIYLPHVIFDFGRVIKRCENCRAAIACVYQKSAKTEHFHRSHTYINTHLIATRWTILYAFEWKWHTDTHTQTNTGMRDSVVLVKHVDNIFFGLFCHHENIPIAMNYWTIFTY